MVAAARRLRLKRIVVLARAPRPGHCKTRLIPKLGALGAARMQRALTFKTLRTALASGARVELWCAPDIQHPFFLACRRELGVRLRRQPRGDLGRRMALALADGAVLTGTDCPGLLAADFRAASRALAGGADAVLQPSRDGGYVLVGARALPRRALAGISWSSGGELAQTRARFARLGLKWRELSPRDDVDTPSDHRRARRGGLL